MKMTVVPATPGYEVLTLGPDLKFRSYAVVAWIINSHGVCATALPVCVGWRCGGEVILKQPDGSIRFTGDRKFDKGQEAEALAHAVSLRPNNGYLVIVPDGIYWETDGAEAGVL
jgi:hypothetical protein